MFVQFHHVIEVLVIHFVRNAEENGILSLYGEYEHAVFSDNSAHHQIVHVGLGFADHGQAVFLSVRGLGSSNEGIERLWFVLFLPASGVNYVLDARCAEKQERKTNRCFIYGYDCIIGI